MGNAVTRYTGPIGHVISGMQIGYSFHMDICNGNSDYYETAITSADVAGGMAGFYIGFELGTYVGLCFGGVGAIPCSIIGGAIGGFIGSCGGSSVARYAVQQIYNNQ